MGRTEASVDFIISDVEYVRLSEFERFDDGSGWRATIRVGAGEFICTGRQFYFGDPDKFLEDLKKCNRELVGFAELKTPYEEEFLRFSFQQLGHVSITGLLRDYAGRDCYFRYEIAADQSFIPNLIESLEAVLAELDG